MSWIPTFIIDFYNWCVDKTGLFVVDIYSSVTSGWETIHNYNANIVTMLGNYSNYVAAANVWVPLDTLADAVFAFVVFWTIYKAYRFARGLIPGLS